MKSSIKISALLCVFFIFFGSAHAQSVSETGPAVKVDGRRLLVDFDGDGNYEPYLIKGVGYQPTPVGSWPLIPDDPKILERDFSLLKNMHCNTIRTWAEVNKALLDYAQKYGIKVIAGFKPYADDVEFSDPENRIRIINQFKDYVSVYKDHPAILFWAIGNEDNYHYKGKDITDWYAMANEMAKQARDLEGKNFHPVAIVNGHILNIGDLSKKADDKSMAYIDIWGANVYMGHSFEKSAMGNLFGQFARKSRKPLWISEYGIDAWDHVNKKEQQEAQAEWVGNNWDEIAKSSVCIGATLMAYSDEWWKAGDPDSHDFGGYGTDAWGKTHPDNYSNEEWWGVVAAERTEGGIDKVIPRKVYYTLLERWARPYDLEAKYSQAEPEVINPATASSSHLGEGLPVKKPLSKGPVQIKGKELLVEGKPFFIKGIAYQPTPIGYNVAEYDIFSDANIYNRDFKLLREMRCNTIRTWARVTNKAFLDAAYNNGKDPIYIIMGIWINPHTLDYSNPLHRKRVIEEFESYVKEFKDHPAVLMWSIGNEQNAWYKGDVSLWYSLVNDMAKAAFKIEGENYHPVTTPNGDIDNIGDTPKNADDNSMNYLDLWGANVYRGDTFGSLFAVYRTKSQKPLWISEYGTPSWDYLKRNDENTAEDPKTLKLFCIQSYSAERLWDEMTANSDVCRGGTLMAYSDEWWKAGNPSSHDVQDGVEWYGVMSVEKNGGKSDIMHPRKVYYTLKDKWSKEIKKRGQ
ncbi:MAG: glycoside hydrolase family 2 TIM barrel-domain containing protein [Candidatus Omnitrophota bacterium]|nr:glycoside hydrolase family 2 TIM barrel-domain containing protein [Candidatus Omnitrophota bacterium]